jgi:hypothetical protein
LKCNPTDALARFFDINVDVAAGAEGIGVPRGAIPPASTFFFELWRRKHSSKGDNDGSKDEKGSEHYGSINGGVGDDGLYVKVWLWTPCKFRKTATAAAATAAARREYGMQGVTCPAMLVHVAACADANNKNDTNGDGNGDDNGGGNGDDNGDGNGAMNNDALLDVCSLRRFAAVASARVKRTGPWEQLCSPKATAAAEAAAVAAVAASASSASTVTSVELDSRGGDTDDDAAAAAAAIEKRLEGDMNGRRGDVETTQRRRSLAWGVLAVAAIAVAVALWRRAKHRADRAERRLRAVVAATDDGGGGVDEHSYLVPRTTAAEANMYADPTARSPFA